MVVGDDTSIPQMLPSTAAIMHILRMSILYILCKGGAG
jgi:hypothetical protein